MAAPPAIATKLIHHYCDVTAATSSPPPLRQCNNHEFTTATITMQQPRPYHLHYNDTRTTIAIPLLPRPYHNRCNDAATTTIPPPLRRCRHHLLPPSL
ncbi:hypothetical protein Acr_24g0013270 [Actinidia rufa]|uniref:Uncharacterized protein n=1 Tax=Actinidia rufa TaxID=165716 RepID=A0A7J0GWB7_9ERIC|nr:hypothetical protein Acr_24g0013270 [Actinidia rufa]